MLDVNLLRKDITEVANKLALRGFILDVEYFAKLESNRRELQIKMEELQCSRNSISKQIGIAKAKGEDPKGYFTEVALINDALKNTELDFGLVNDELTKLLEGIPNILDDQVPFGVDETQNKEIRRVGIPRDFDFEVRDHVDLGFNLNKQMDFELGSKIACSRFVVLKDKIAKLHRALAQFMLDMHTEGHGYQEMYVPYLANSKSMFGVGQLPKFEEDLFKTRRGDDDLYLISTAEVSLTNIVADTILEYKELPLKFVAHTPSFRSEAGSYGRDTRGMIRMHQFDKVELVHIVEPHLSYLAHEEMTSHAESILKTLGLPYRVMLLCSGDTGFSSTKTYDLEVWLPSQGVYREISSCSRMGDFQARRMKARYKTLDGKNEFVHTLNGSALAVGRTLVAVLENYQNVDGSINVPEVLQGYMGCDIIR
ncbi:MAG: serine--tRNA ligase [Bacteroidia bacterium]|nr:MAG: serine--tRNA ligase [Bacteroidia bacterium]